MKNNFFELIKSDDQTKARAGVLNTSRGQIETPIFMPVGTLGSVKAISFNKLKEIGAQIILGNTYHLYLRPGMEVIDKFEGLHNFNTWEKPILTDSGGYQVFSLQDIRKLDEDGVEFSSHIDGSKHYFTPEKVVDIQRNLGSDIMMVLDECVPYPSERSYVEKSIELSLSWAERSKARLLETKDYYFNKQFLFGIGQGGMYKDLRLEYVKRMVDIGFDGYAIGGLSVGEPAEIMYDITDVCTEVMPKNKPRYLMGVGTPENILESIERGVDMFDCVLPTRNARNGQIFTTRGIINIKNAKYKFSKELIDVNLSNGVSEVFSLGYLHHLIKSGEIFGLQIATIQNLSLYLWLVKNARAKILAGEYRQWKGEILSSISSKY